MLILDVDAILALSPTELHKGGEHTISVHDYVSAYEFRGDGHDHSPCDAEKELLEDAIEGYLSTQITIPSQLVDVNIRRMTGLIETAEDGNSWEQEAKAEMQKAIRALTRTPDSGKGGRE